MKILGKELTFNGNKVYHAGNKPTASEIGAAASNHTHNYAGSSSAGGNANAAVKLATARTINGTNFDGSANITTANWGTARNIQIGNTSKSVNGSANVSWSLSEIGAAAASHGRHIPDVCETITDWNNATKNGWYMGNNATNSPTANAWYFGEVIAHNANYVVQTVYQFTASTDAKAIPKYIRAKMNGTWGAWTNVTVSKAVPSNAVFTDTNTWRGVQDNLTSTATDQSLSANQGKVLKGLIDGKAASNHTHSYLPLSGGTMTGAISSSLNTGTYLDGNKGRALVNSTNTAGGYTALVKSNSTNGYFTQATYQGNHLLQYTAKSTVDAGNNSVTKTVTLLNESGNSSFPGTVSAPTFSGALSGNATTATKLQTARTITLSGDVTGSASFDGSANASIAVNNRRCVVGQTSNTNTNPYYKFAAITISGNHQDREIVFKVSTGYSQNTASGILRAHLRTNSEGLLDNAQFNWEYANIGIDPSKFIMAYSTTTPMVVELWAKVDSAYLHYHFDVIQEHDRGDSRSRWTLYTTCAAGSASAITSGYTQLVSTRLNIANSITGNANTATTLQTARTINGTSFNGSGNITTANWGTARNITIGNTTKSVNGSANVSWTAAEIGVASINDSTTATGTVWSSNKTQVQINTSYNTMSQKVDALEESINRDFVSKNGSTMTGDLTIKKSNGAAAKLNVHRTINSNDMQGTIDIYAHNGGSVALSTNNKTSGKQTSSYVFGGDAFWSPRNADGTVPSIGLSNYRFEKAWLNKLDAKDAIFTSGNLTVQGQTTLGPTILNNNTSLYGYNTSGTQINICGVDNSNNIYLGWNNQTYINVNNTMRVYRDLHILNGNALRVTGQTVLARTESYRQIAVVSTAGDGNGKGDGQTHLGYFDSGYHHYFRGSGAMHVDMLGGLKIEGKRLSIGSAAHSNPATGDVWIQI